MAEDSVSSTLLTAMNRTEEGRKALTGISPGIVENLKCVDDIRQRMELLQDERANLETQTCMNKSNIPLGRWSNEPQVLGPVGLLAEIKSEGRGKAADLALQAVISWHWQDVLRAVVVETYAKYKELKQKNALDEEEGFMLLEIMKTNPDLEETLQELPSIGNPVYVRNLFQFSNAKHAEASKVFNNIIENTILIDDEGSARELLSIYNERCSSTCPTILTRDGHRLESVAMICDGQRNTIPNNWADNAYKIGLAEDPGLKRITNELTALCNLKIVMEGEDISSLKSN